MEGISTERSVKNKKQNLKNDQRYETLKLIVILSASMLTIMGAAAIAPALPEMLEILC